MMIGWVTERGKRENERQQPTNAASALKFMPAMPAYLAFLRPHLIDEAIAHCKTATH